jgi:hypothetical protein
VEAAVKGAINELLKVNMPGSAPAPPSTAPPPSSAAPSTSSAGASTTIKGQWIGTLRRAGTTDTIGCDLHVASSGRPLWTYYDTNGFRQTELTHEGQTIEYVPPERGVMRVIVQSVTGSSIETGYVVDSSFERSSNGYLTQRYQRIVLAGRLRGPQLDVTYSETGVSSFGDKTGLAATEGAKEYRGSLTKQA